MCSIASSWRLSTIAVLGDAKAPAAQQAVRTASTTRLPWTVHAVSLRDVDSGRSPLLMAAVVMMAVLILGSGYLAYRAVSRELHVAKLQSDFNSALAALEDALQGVQASAETSRPHLSRACCSSCRTGAPTRSG